MHEMSIALNIMKIAQEELEKENARIVDEQALQPGRQGLVIEKIHLSVGKLSGVVVESLRFALEASRKDGPLLNADIIIENVPGKMLCLSCNHEFEAEDYYVTCPKCNAYKHKAISGKELIIKSLTIS
jgi:hydrogenase nickel incorporation protein HypA/HybF